MSAVGIERVIPIRFIHPRPTADGLLNAPVSGHYEAIARANAAFRDAGIQFKFLSANSYSMPIVSRINRLNNSGGVYDEINYSWSAIQQEFIQVPYLAVTSSSYISLSTARALDWYTDVVTRHGPQDAIVVLVQGYDASGPTPLNFELRSGFASGPHQNRTIVVGGDFCSPQYGLAHELGHHFNLPHTWGLSVLDPSTNAFSQPSDWWDLIFCPSNNASTPHEYYSSRQDVLNTTKCNSNQFRSIDGKDSSNGNVDAYGFMTCQITAPGSPRVETKNSNNDEIRRGLGPITTNGYGSTTLYGQNLMSYYVPNWNWPAPDCRECANLRLSGSQIEFVKKSIRYEIFTQQNATWDNLPGGRTKLGSRPVAHSRLSYGIFIDNDSKRDIVIWEPARDSSSTGKFRVLLSTKNFSTAPADMLEVNIGGVDAIPVVGKFNNDALMDLGVFYPGTSSGSQSTQAYWKLCYTQSTPTTPCPTATPIAFGERRDTPLNDTNFNGSGSGEIGLYRPDTKQWFWSVYPYSNYSSKTPVSASLLTASYTPLPDDYDRDGTTDMAGYEPNDATFYLNKASSSWNSVNSFAMGADFIPAAGTSSSPGDANQRGGPVLVPGLVSGASFYPAFSVWEANNATWKVVWQAGTTSPYTTTCSFGQAGDLPIAITNPSYYSGNSFSPLAVFRRSTSSSNVDQLHLISGNDCNYANWQSKSYSVLPKHLRVAPVADLTGDGKPDLLRYDQNNGQLRWWTSESNYTSLSSTIYIGSDLAELL